KQKEDGIFISQDKYVSEILKKFGFTDVKTASTPMETQKSLLKDENGEEVDVHLYRSMIGSLMYLTSSRHDIMFAVCACARYQVNPKVSHLHAMKRIFRYLKGQPKLGLWYLKDSPFDLAAYTDSDYAGASLDRKDSNEKKLIQMIKIHTDKNGADLLTKAFDLNKNRVKVQHTKPYHTPTIIQPLTSQPQKKQRLRRLKRKDIEIPQSSGPTNNVVDEAVNEEMDNSLVKAATTASSLEAEQYSGNIDKTRSKATLNEPSSLGTSSRVNTPRSDEDRLKLNELMEFCTKLQQRVLDLENTKTAQAQEITSLKLRVKKLEKKGGSRTHKLKRLYKGRKIDDIDKDAEITLVHETQGRYGDEEMFDTGVLDGDEVLAEPEVTVKDVNLSVDEVTLAQALAALKSAKVKAQDKGKGIMVEEPMKIKKNKIKSVLMKNLLSSYKLKKKKKKGLPEKKLKEKKKPTLLHEIMVNTFVDMDTELVEGGEVRVEGSDTRTEGSSKRAGEDLQQESIMKQKVDEDKETTELKD
ncbi:hypothetical protein Tco_0455879, partial [Tanacetum coccineum]